MIAYDHPFALDFAYQQGIAAIYIAGFACEGPGAYYEVVIGREAIHAFDVGGELAHVRGIGICLFVALEGSLVAVTRAFGAYEEQAVAVPVALHVTVYAAAVPGDYLVYEHVADGEYVFVLCDRSGVQQQGAAEAQQYFFHAVWFLSTGKIQPYPLKR